VRFNDDVREYIKAALSPAKVSEIRLDREKMKAEVIVDDDQLSLSIGKHGQNVRLASRLVGWELDIRTKSMIAAEALGGSEENKAAPRRKKEPRKKRVPRRRRRLRKNPRKESRKPAKSEAAPSLEDLPG